MVWAGCPTVKGLSPERVYLTECADALENVAGHAGQHVHGECCPGARGRRPDRASQPVTAVTREVPALLSHADEYARRAEEAEGGKWQRGSRIAA